MGNKHKTLLQEIKQLDSSIDEVLGFGKSKETNGAGPKDWAQREAEEEVERMTSSDPQKAVHSDVADPLFQDDLADRYLKKVLKIAPGDEKYEDTKKQFLDIITKKEGTRGYLDDIKRVEKRIARPRSAAAAKDVKKVTGGALEDKGGFFGAGWGTWRPGMGMNPKDTLEFPPDWEKQLDDKWGALRAKNLKRKLQAQEDAGKIDVPGPEGGDADPATPPGAEVDTGAEGDTGAEAAPEKEVELEADKLLHSDSAEALAQAGLGATIDKAAEKIKQRTPMKRLAKTEKDLDKFVPQLKKSIEDFINKNTREATFATAKGAAPEVGARAGSVKLAEALNNVVVTTADQRILVEVLKKYNRIILAKGYSL
jgi:hypothetical protein